MRHLACAMFAAATLAAFLCPGTLALAEEPAALVLDKAETAGICAFRSMWDQPVLTAADGVRVITDAVVKDRGGTAPWHPKFRENGAKPGALAFDAMRRSLLVRFPEAAEKIAAKLNEGNSIEKVELVLPFKDEELWPEGSGGGGVGPEGGYEYRANWGVDELYRKHRPTWHALAWLLRKPWKADAQTGPTFNAHIAGAGYWKKYGAADIEEDRFAKQFGPAPVHFQAPDGRMDVTAVLKDEAFGKTLAERLRTLADCGFILRKWETYDHRYYNGCYEWATATGGRAIVIEAPKLIVTFKKDGAAKVDVPPAGGTRVSRLPVGGALSPAGGKPTAVMPTAEELDQLAKRHAPARPAWMPEWQWERVKSLLTVRRGQKVLDEPFWMQFPPEYLVDRRFGSQLPQGPKRSKADLAYEVWVDCMMGSQPRGWNGFEASVVLMPYLLYRDALPGPARDTFTEYWTNWLMPDRPTAPLEKHLDQNYFDGPLVHPMVDQLKKVQATKSFSGGDSYFNKTQDWRGNKSFYRSGFTYCMSTMNFNHTSAMGALLGGSIVNSEFAMADGRHGIENFPLRLWCWYDGTTQESIDHYYLSLTLTAQKMVADFGPTHFDRMLGKSILLKTVDELAGAYHPGLRRFVAGSMRTAPNHLFVSQDGVYHIVHSLSRKGVLRDLDMVGKDKDMPGGMPVIGQEVAPEHVARQTLQGPWAPEWTSAVVDDKPLPWEMTCTFKQWGGHAKIPIMRRSYLGTQYGLYSADCQTGIVPILGHWRRADKTVERMQEVGTLLLRYGINTTRLVNTDPGWMPTLGQQSTLQHKGKLIVVTSPHQWVDPKLKIKSLQSTIALYNYEAPAPTWQVCVDGKPAGPLPLKLKAAQRITIKDGVSYLGVIPLPATDLGRAEEVVVCEGDAQEFGKVPYKAALVINNYNLQREQPLDDKADFAKIDRAYGGFVVEMADATEYPTFEEFQKHIAAAKLDASGDVDKALAQVKYVSGDDTMELGVLTTYKEGETLDRLFAYRRVNGAWPYLPEGVERDTPVARQASTGRLEKNGAVLLCEPGRMAYIQADPATSTYAAYNPMPDLTLWRFTLPGGLSVKADGKVGLAHVVVRPKESQVWVDYATRPGTQGADLAKALVLEGFQAPPVVTLNGKRLEQTASIATGGAKAYVVPLAEELAAKDLDALSSRLDAAATALDALKAK